jgi:ornithine cyclodeaminase
MTDIKILTEAELRSQISLDLAAIECGSIDSSSSFAELGELISEQATGRQDENEITLCDLTGTGIQDTAIATLAYQQCLRHKAGTTFVT